MTDDMPREIWAASHSEDGTQFGGWIDLRCDNQQTKYIHHTTHEAALEALEVAREELKEIEYSSDMAQAVAKKALEQIDSILGGE